MRIRPWYLLGVAVTALAGLSACQVGVTGGAGQPVAGGSASASTAAASPSASTAPPSPSTSSSATPRPPALSRGCTDTHIRVTRSTEDGAAGTQVQRFILTNTGMVACTMRGHPFLSLYGPKKQGGTTVQANLDIAVGYIPATFGDLGTAPTTLTLAPGRTAVFFLKWSSVPVGDKACDNADGFDFRPPQDTDTGDNKLVAFRFQPCGGQVQVSAVLPATVGD
jgi:Protein of unknown function (DUF4232)